RSLGGAALMLSLVLYPYVYLTARTAFLEQSVCVLEAARTLGCSAWRSFAVVALPLARPAIIAGVALALMETLNDFGTVQHFAVDTFTTGIFRTWFGLGEPAAAAQLGAVLMLFVLALLLIERYSRGRGRVHHTTSRYRALPGYCLTGWRAAAAFLLCATPVALGFLVPAGVLVVWAWQTASEVFDSRFAGFAFNSLILAGLTAVLAGGLALTLAYGVRLCPRPLVRGAVRVAAMGYAVPGSVIAVGVLLPAAWLDNAVDGWARATFGMSTGLLLTGTVTILVYAYLVRFLAVSLGNVESSLGKVTPSMDAAARTLGEAPGGVLRRVHAPILRGSLLAAGLLVFVDVMKELPATLILRPFNFDTLAVRTYQLASDERLHEAAGPGLAIVVVGIIPVILLSRAIRRSRPGHHDA
ncbi:MAG TPA: iron ABC transporter permease, partial [Azospirillaceae bacterium]|nr:iron ABC transporter permease [Azospirillaceae bacterium]